MPARCNAPAGVKRTRAVNREGGGTTSARLRFWSMRAQSGGALWRAIAPAPAVPDLRCQSRPPSVFLKAQAALAGAFADAARASEPIASDTRRSQRHKPGTAVLREALRSRDTGAHAQAAYVIVADPQRGFRMQPGSATAAGNRSRGDGEMRRLKVQTRAGAKWSVLEQAFLRPGRQGCRRRYHSNSAGLPRLR